MSEKTKVFIIENNQADALLIENLLDTSNGNDFSANCSSTITEAIRLLRSGSVMIDVILLNLNLPDSGGLDTLMQIMVYSGNIPVIILSDTGDENEGINAIQRGAQDFLLRRELSAQGLIRAICYARERKFAERKLAEDALIKAAEEELKLSRALEYSSTSIVITDSDGNIEYVNPAFIRESGYSYDEVIGRNPRILKSGLTDESIFKDLWDTLKRRKEWKGEFCNCRKNGEIYWESASIAPVMDVNGKIIQYVAVKENITAQKEMHEALSWEKYLLDSLLDTHPDSIYFKDEQSRIIRISLAGAIKSGFDDPRKMIGKTDFDLFTGEQASLAYEYEQMIIKTGMPMVNMEEKETYADKRSTWALTTKLPLRNNKGKIIGTFGISRDITERKQADDALSDSRTRYISLFEDSPTPMWEEDFSEVKRELDKLKKSGITDFFGYFKTFPEKAKSLTLKIKVLNINKAVLKLHRAYKKEDILNDFTVVFTDETYKTMGYELAMIANGERLFDFNQEVRTLDMNTRHVILRWSVAEGYEKNLSRVLISIVDITENKRVEEALRENEAQLKEAQQIAHIGSWIFYPDTQKLIWTDELFRIYGTDPKLGSPSFAMHQQFLHPEDWSKLNYLNQHINENRGDQELELRVTRPDGQLRIVIWKSQKVYNESNQIVKVIGTAQDITEMKKVERELHLYREYLEEMIKVRTEELEETKLQNELILNAVGDGIIGMDRDGRVSFINPAAAKMISWEIEEILGQRQHQLIHHTKSDGSVYEIDDCPIHHTIHEGVSHHVFNEVFWRKDYTSFQVEYISTPIFENNKLMGAVVVFSDITERKKAENALKEAKDAAEAATKAKSEFLANMSHEIRTPMNAIIGFSDILSIAVKEEKQKTQVNAIRTSARSLLIIINDILDLSKIEAGKLRISFEPVDLGHLIQEVENVFLPRLKDKALQFIIESQNHLFKNIMIDEIRLRQILLNLIGNAIKFTEKGFVKLIVREEMHENDFSKLNLHIIVKDSGIGIRKEQQKIIFEAFNQQIGQSNRKYGGTGLGLTITKRLVEMMGGTISVYSEHGKGSTFEVVFPGILISGNTVNHTEENRYDPASILFEQAKVLICDDNEADRVMITDMLELFPFTVIQATDGKSAVDMAEIHSPDLIVMDLKMPDMNGIETTKLIKAIPSFINTPVLLISASAKLTQLRDDYAGLFKDFLMKPVHLVEILESLKKCLVYKVQSTNQNEDFEIPEFIDISEAQHENMPVLVNQFNTSILPLYSEVLQNQKMDLIEDFGKKIIALGEDHGFIVLIQFGQQVCKHAGNFDIEKLLTILKMLPNLIDKFK